VSLFESPQTPNYDVECLKTIEAGLASDPANEDLKALLLEVKEQYDADHLINVQAEEKDRFERMFKWMKDDGAKFDKLKMRYYGPDYRGVHAARDIKKGEIILYVPKQEIITLEMAMESPIGALMAAKNMRHRLLSPKHSFLSCFIMQEKRKPHSYFKEFIDILPKNFTNFPIFYTVEERAWLEGSAMQNVITDKIKDIATDYNTICTEVPEFKQFSLKEYSEMRMMVCSRIFGISINGVKTDGFVAYADMLNHQRPKET
jgi:histone-lysine N-methyltransferase SETD3